MTVLIGFLICRPVAKNWDPTVHGTCGNRIAGYTAVSVVNVVVDCLMLILPLPMIYNLQTKPGYKLGLSAIFSIGIVLVPLLNILLGLLTGMTSRLHPADNENEEQDHNLLRNTSEVPERDRL